MILVDIPFEQYRNALRERLQPRFSLFSERLSGIMIGRFFSVAYYSSYEWNRQITCECNRAIGYIRDVNGMTEVHYIRSKGQFSPSWLLFFFLIAGFIWYMVCGIVGGILLGAVNSVIICGITAIHSAVTEEGEAGEKVISMLLEDPETFYYC